MKIAYGTYAMPTVPLEEAIPALAGMGYDGVEICMDPRHVGSMPEDLDPARRKLLRRLLQDTGMGIPALFPIGPVHIYTENRARHEQSLDFIRVCAGLARDLGMAEPPVIAAGIGGKRDQWDDIKGRLVDILGDYGRVAEEEDVIIAGEAHCGAAVDRTERAVWLFETVNHPRVKMHFDIVHTFLSGDTIEDAVRALVPHTAHTHITDTRRCPDGSFGLVLIGMGELDSAAYVRAMHEAGWDDYITLEVSGQVWGREDYVPLAAAQFCYAVLNRAFERAGVARG